MNNRNPFQPGDLVAAYLRDSGGEAQELSITRQQAEFQRWCTENGLILGQVFKDEARRGSSVVGRAGFQDMMRYFRSDRIPERGLVIWNYQRFARDIDDSQFFRADIRRRGYLFYSLNDDIPEGPMGRLFEAALDWKNEQFLLDLSADVKSGLRELVQRYGAIPGTPPRGFAREPIQISSRRDGRPRLVHRWVPDPELIPLVRQAYQMLLAGASLAEIQAATRLYRSVNSFTTFFSNPLYKGVLEFGDLVIENYCEPVIDPDLWQQAQAVIARRARHQHLSGDNPQHPRRTNSIYLLSGIAYCARCGSPFSGLTVNQPGGTAYERYACSRQKRNHDCDAETIPRLFLEEMILSTFQEYILLPANLAARQAIILQGEDQRQAALRQSIADQRQRLGLIRRRIANITDTLADLGKSRALLTKLAALEQEEAEVLTGLVALERQQGGVYTPLAADQLSARSDRLQELLANSDPTTVRRLLRGLLQRIIVERDQNIVRVQLHYYFPPEEHPPPDLSSISPNPLGAPSQRHIFTHVIVVPWIRKLRKKKMRPLPPGGLGSMYAPSSP